MNIDNITNEVWALLLELCALPEWSYPMRVPELQARAQELIRAMNRHGGASE